MKLLIILGVFIGYAYGQFAYNPYNYNGYFSPRYLDNYYPSPYQNYYNGFPSYYNPSYNYYGSRLAQASQVYPQYAKGIPKYTPVYPQYSHLYPKHAGIPSIIPRISQATYTNENNARILKFDSEVHPEGGYHYNYETENGIIAQEVGGPKVLGGPNVAQGSFGWVSPEGKVVSVSYVADENGYRPVNNNVDSAPVAIAAARAVTEKPKTS